ncbi:MAG TPA: hotdog fold domain-containing protein [Thermodesulfobacteriota bacterium]
MALEAAGSCFVCGAANPGGLRLAFEVDRDARTLRTTCRPPEVYQSWEGIVHGGLVATLLDEAMGKLAQELGRPALTAALDVRFRRPARVGDTIDVEAAIDAMDRRLITARAVAYGPGRTVLAEATAKLMPAR